MTEFPISISLITLTQLFHKKVMDEDCFPIKAHYSWTNSEFQLPICICLNHDATPCDGLCDVLRIMWRIVWRTVLRIMWRTVWRTVLTHRVTDHVTDRVTDRVTSVMSVRWLRSVSARTDLSRSSVVGTVCSIAVRTDPGSAGLQRCPYCRVTYQAVHHAPRSRHSITQVMAQLVRY